jgi:hypothetical protein
VGVNGEAVLEAILTSPTAYVDAKTAIADLLFQEDSNQNIIEQGQKGSAAWRVDLRAGDA